jgi:Flp pilus assembly protein TadG
MALLMALLLVVFMGMAALAIDYGYLTAVQGELQAAADAGALAGAQALGSISNPDWAAAQTAATSLVQKNQANGQLLTDCQVDYGYWSKLTHKLQPYTITPQSTDIPAVKVVVAKGAGNNGGALQLFFAPILPGVSATQDLSGTAIAMIKASAGLWSILETANGTVTINNNANVQRDVGIYGTGASTVNNNAVVQGKIYLNTSTPKTTVGNNGVVQGGIQKDAGSAATVKQATQAATTAYNNFVALSPTMTSITTVNSTRTITGSAGVNVLNVTNFRPSNNAIITLSAPAKSSFVIRVSNAFTLNNNSKVVLSGGITSDGVTFVYTRNNSTATLSNNSIMNGSILSPNSNITLSNNASINGGVLVSGRNITLNNNSISTDKNPWLTVSGSGQGAALVQ